MSLTDRAFASSWSGGKDSALALDRAVREGGRLAALFTMFTEGGERSRSHGLPRSVLAAQVAALGVPLFRAPIELLQCQADTFASPLPIPVG